MVNLLKNEDTAMDGEVYSVFHTLEHRTQEDIAQAAGIIGMVLKNDSRS
jgi:hypothetical protein